MIEAKNLILFFVVVVVVSSSYWTQQLNDCTVTSSHTQKLSSIELEGEEPVGIKGERFWLLKPAPGWPSGTNGIKKKYISIKKKEKIENVHKMLNAGGE